MHLMLRYLGTGAENTLVFLLDYGDEGYPVSSPIMLAGMIPSVERVHAPGFLPENAEIPTVTGASVYTVPSGGLILDRTEYSQLILPSIVDALTWDIVELVEALLSRRVYAFYRAFGDARTSAAAAVLTAGEPFGNRVFAASDLLAVRNPSNWYNYSTKIGECGRAEGFVAISFWAWLLPLLPAPDASKFCPLALFAAPAWLPNNYDNNSRRYALSEKVYTVKEDGIVKHGRYIVSYYDAYINGGVVYGPYPFSGNLIEAAGYNFELTSFEGVDVPFGGWTFTVGGGYAGWTSQTEYIDEHVRVDCYDTLTSLVVVDLPPSNVDFLPFIDKPIDEVFGIQKMVAPFQVFIVDGTPFEVGGSPLEVRE